MARLTRANGESNLELTLVARCRTLELKYALQSEQLFLFPFKSEGGALYYGLVIPDDATQPMVLWAACRDEPEYSILKELENNSTLTIHFYNEACVNVASSKFLAHAGAQFAARLENPIFEPNQDSISASEVRGAISRELLNTSAKVTLSRETPWSGAVAHLIGGQNTSFALDLFVDEEGGHQEQLTGWLADSVRPDVLKMNLKYIDGKQNKEFADVTLSCGFRCILIESKTLAILRRLALPFRADLRSDVAKKIMKATKQLKGGCRSLHSRKPIIDEAGSIVSLYRDSPAHAICLIPDHSLLEDPGAYAATFSKEFAAATGDIFHLMDLGQLYRIVQAAQMLSATLGGSVMERFDQYLMQRSEIVVRLDSVLIDMALDLREGKARIRVTEGYE